MITWTQFILLIWILGGPLLCIMWREFNQLELAFGLKSDLKSLLVFILGGPLVWLAVAL